MRSSGGNLKAIAHRGALLVKPSVGAQREVVDLHDDAVDLVGQIVAMLLPALAEVVDRRSSCTTVISGLTGRPSSRSQAACRGGCERRRALDLAELVAPERELAAGGDRRDPSAAATRPRCCAGWRTRAGPLRPGLVDALEDGERHVDLAPHLDDARRALRSRLGIDSMARTLAVTSSPTRPSPRVAACTSRPPS